MRYLKQFFLINLVVLFVVILSNLFDFRLCVIYNIFKIPCPGCGMTRSFILMLKGDFVQALKYSIISPLIILLYIIVIIWNFFDYKTNKNTFMKYTNKYKMIIIIVFAIIALIQWVINLNNSILY